VGVQDGAPLAVARVGLVFVGCGPAGGASPLSPGVLDIGSAYGSMGVLNTACWSGIGLGRHISVVLPRGERLFLVDQVVELVVAHPFEEGCDLGACVADVDIWMLGVSDEN
jgi:hypothetical protein